MQKNLDIRMWQSHWQSFNSQANFTLDCHTILKLSSIALSCKKVKLLISLSIFPCMLLKTLLCCYACFATLEKNVYVSSYCSLFLSDAQSQTHTHSFHDSGNHGNQFTNCMPLRNTEDGFLKCLGTSVNVC